jgi:hypothetical protein
VAYDEETKAGWEGRRRREKKGRWVEERGQLGFENRGRAGGQESGSTLCKEDKGGGVEG